MLDRLNEAFLFDRTIDIDTDDCHTEKLREELTLVKIDRHVTEKVWWTRTARVGTGSVIG